ncbi:TM2 domain-containing protein [Pendulispora albinea]|uniref:TM2 domain-containing protein n=1 Tax=Pendulispora albinea TaxID=2741071 RepID=A0ABZ2LT25_9BACT
MQGGNPPPPGGGGGGGPGGGYGQGPNNAYGGGYGPPPPAGMSGMPGMPMGPPPGAGPGAPYGIDPVTGIPFSDKSKVVAALLQFFLGWLGAGRFYTGHTGIAIAQILASLTCIGWIWPIVDGIMMLTGKVTDAQGRPLRDGV